MSDFERKIGFGDTYGTRAEVEVDEDGEVKVTLAVGIFASVGGFPTAEATRQFAAGLLDALDAAQQAGAES